MTSTPNGDELERKCDKTSCPMYSKKYDLQIWRNQKAPTVFKDRVKEYNKYCKACLVSISFWIVTARHFHRLHMIRTRTRNADDGDDDGNGNDNSYDDKPTPEFRLDVQRLIVGNPNNFVAGQAEYPYSRNTILTLHAGKDVNSQRYMLSMSTKAWMAIANDKDAKNDQSSRVWLSDATIPIFLLMFAKSFGRQRQVVVHLPDQMIPFNLTDHNATRPRRNPAFPTENDYNNSTTLQQMAAKCDRFLDAFNDRGTQLLSRRQPLRGVFHDRNTLQVILIPINTKAHWTMGVVDLIGREHFYIDTLGLTARQHMDYVRRTAHIRRIMDVTTLHLTGIDTTGFQYTDMGLTISQQQDSYSCGYNILRYAESIIQRLVPGQGIGNIPDIVIDDAGTTAIRKRMAAMLRAWNDASYD